MRSNKVFFAMLLGLIGLTAALVFLALRQDERLAEIEVLERAPTAPPLRELRGGLRQVASGQTVYVPVYSHIYASGGKEQLLEVTLSIRNTDLDQPIVVNSIRYYDTEGRQLKEYLQAPVVLDPMASTDFLVEQRDTRGGSGANFLIDWTAEAEVTQPVIEAVMIGVDGHRAFSFVRPGYPLSTYSGEGSP